jgi:hypothetical protein
VLLKVGLPPPTECKGRVEEANLHVLEEQRCSTSRYLCHGSLFCAEKRTTSTVYGRGHERRCLLEYHASLIMCNCSDDWLKTQNATPGNGQRYLATVNSRPYMPTRTGQARRVNKPYRRTSLTASEMQFV